MTRTRADWHERATACLACGIGLVLAVGWQRANGQGTATMPPAGQTVTLRTILVGSEQAAETIVTRLNGGESFVLIARTESIAPSAQNGGWLGKVALQDLRPEVQKALNGVAPGHITAIVRVPTGFAIFKVEEDESAGASSSPLTADLSAAGVVKFVVDVSGFTDARASLDQISRSPDWNMSPSAICEARTRSLSSAQSSIERYLSPANQEVLATRLPIDVMQLHVILAQLDAFQGLMDGAVAEFEEAYRLAASEAPATAAQMEESLAVAYLHKAGVDNDAYSAPGDMCLLTLPPAPPYRKPGDVTKAIEHFSHYLDQNPDDLEVRWLLNLAYMRAGGYPEKVPKAYLMPPSVFQSSEDVGRFRDVAPQAGLVSFASAGGVLVDDFRNTGRFDVITSTADKCGPMRMLVNNGDGTFSDRTAAAGLAGQLGGLNLVQGDYNNDGCPDVLVLRGGWEDLPERKSLLRNNCDGTFTDVTMASGLAQPTAAQTAVFTDIDNDGFLDLFVGVENGPAQLFRNKRDGTFQDIARAAGVDRIAYAKGVAAADYDNDRYPDLYVSNYGGTNFLYHNNRDGTFTEVSAAANVPGTPQGFATWFFDYDNDGWQDLFVTSYVASLDEMVRDYLGMPHRATTMKLYRNLHDGSFRDVSVEAGLTRVRMPMGANYGDIDNDGFLDMYLGTGNPSYAALAGSVLLRNRNGQSFVDVTTSSGTGELHRGHGVAFADIDNDGDEDIVFEVGGMTQGDRHAIRLFENPGHGNDWIAVKLVGVKSNRTAVGARTQVTVKNDSGQTRAIYRTVGPGGSFGGSPLLQHIGLGKSAGEVDLEVWWPTTDTRQQFSNVGKNRWLQIQEFAREFKVLKRDPVRLGGGGTRR